ncbi:hypothetical protein [Sodalis-like endosymbiont of Proechinophthirus fluctus]|uniref:hypothetical protein n=1 Tax=Sodalis-like endosymbiont of Proechinophthirus fluctus TaxID=1462730 RepID=UPI0016503315|nr:hypothetical protein [Sodalis-like endosymbiont of Proechinophthirus fluctus]
MKDDMAPLADVEQHLHSLSGLSPRGSVVQHIRHEYTLCSLTLNRSLCANSMLVKFDDLEEGLSVTTMKKT